MKKARSALRWVALALSIGARVAFAADPYNIDVVLPLTGGAAFLGKAEQLSLQQAEKVLAKGEGIAGRPIKFVFHDDQSSPQTAVQLATQIVNAKPAVVLGSAVVAMCNAMAPLMKNGPVLYCFSPGIYPPNGSFMFTSSVSTRDLIAAQLRYFRLKGWKKVAVITSTDASGQDAARNIKELLGQPEHKEIQLVADTNFNPTDVSASAQIQRIKGAQPQALIAWSTGAAIGTVFKAIAEAGLTIPVATTDGNMTYAQMTQYASFLPKELYIPSPEWLPDAPKNAPVAQVEAKKVFYAAFEGSGAKPDAASSFAWDPAMLVVSALRKLGPNATAAQIREYLAGLKGFAGINGVYDFPKVPQRGLDESSVYITRWSPEQKIWVVVSEPRGIPTP
jgi:branched-chain amino acid transport system substrate-binding protein